MRLRHASESIQIPITGLKADCFYTLQQAVGEGHILSSSGGTFTSCKKRFLEVEIDDIEKHVMDLCIEKKSGYERMCQ